MKVERLVGRAPFTEKLGNIIKGLVFEAHPMSPDNPRSIFYMSRAGVVDLEDPDQHYTEADTCFYNITLLDATIAVKPL